MSKVEGTVHVCAHHVEYWYDVGRMKQTPELLERLEEEAESRAKTCIIDGIVSGELNCLWHGEKEIRGWWNIAKGD